MAKDDGYEASLGRCDGTKIMRAKYKIEPMANGQFLASAANFGIQGLRGGARLIATVLVARSLSTDEFGIYATLTSFIGIGSVAASFGNEVLLIREIARARIERSWAQISGLTKWSIGLSFLITGTVSLVGFVTVLVLDVDIPESIWLAIWISAACVPCAASAMLMSAAIRGFGRTVVGNLVGDSGIAVANCCLLALLLLIGAKFSVELGITVLLGANIVTALVAGTIILVVFKAQNMGAESAYHIRRWASVSFPLVLLSGVQLLISEVDTLMLTWLAGVESTGLYRPSQRLAWLLTFGSIATILTFQPTIASSFARGKHDEFERDVRRSTLIAVAFTLPLVLILLFFGQFILSVFGPAFVTTYDILLILALGQAVDAGIGPTLVSTLSVTGHEKDTLWINVGALVINISLNYVLIPGYGLYGAAWATTAAWITRSILSYIMVRVRLGIDPNVITYFLRYALQRTRS